MKPSELPIYITPSAYEKFVSGEKKEAIAHMIRDITQKVEVKSTYGCMCCDIEVARWKIIDQYGEEKDALFIADHNLLMIPEDKKEEIIASAFVLPII